MIMNHGGSAFPTNVMVDGQTMGMSLRDYFAAQAMQGMISNNSDYGSYEKIAQTSYRMADIMIKIKDINEE